MRKIFVPESKDRIADAVIVGGGIVGTATAFWLSREGLDTIVVEARSGLSTLTTAGSAECFRAQFTEPAIVPLAKQSIDFFENFAELVGIPGWNIGLRQQGYLSLRKPWHWISLIKWVREATTLLTGTHSII